MCHGWVTLELGKVRFVSAFVQLWAVLDGTSKKSSRTNWGCKA